MKQKEKLTNHSHIDARPIVMVLLVLGFMSVILAAAIMASAQSKSNKNGTVSMNPQETAEPESEDNILAVVEGIDNDRQMIELFDVNQLMLLSLSFTEGIEVTDKYGQIISMSQIAAGDMVDASYDSVNSKLTGMNISKRAWEYDDVNNMTIDSDQQVMKIASTKYKYNNNIFVLNEDKAVTADDLTEQDVLKVWGYDQTIWSITVTKGHGTVKLEDYEDYLGDTITIGYESTMQIADHFSVPVREGTYNLTVENGKFSATKNITVKRNQVTYVSLNDLGPTGLKQSEVTFHITPEGADLYVDGKMTSYDDPVSLSYGTHTAKALLGGYTTYQGTVNVDAKSETININLPEEKSDNKAVATQADTGTDTSKDSGGNTDTSASGSVPSDDTSNNASGSSSDGTKYSPGGTDYDLQEGDSTDNDHNIYIKEPSGASVYLNGQYMGTSPCKFTKIIGNHVLTFIKKGYKTASYTVEVNNDNKDAYFTFPELTKSK